MNGGGIGLNFNVTHLIGVKFDFMGYTGKNTVSNATNTDSVQANFNNSLIYLDRSSRFDTPKLTIWQRHSLALVIAAAFTRRSITSTREPARRLTATILLQWRLAVVSTGRSRPIFISAAVEVDYMFTRYSLNNVSAMQNYFKYVVGVNIPMGSH